MSRIIFSIPLLFFAPAALNGGTYFPLLFMIFYILAGVTDMIDGPIARKTNSASELGANLDGAADFVFAFIVLFVAIPVLTIPLWMLFWILIIAVVRISSLVISYIRHREVVMLHTYGNKISAVAMFAILLFYAIGVNLTLLLVVVAIIVSLAYIEDFIINATSKEPKRDIKGLFFNVLAKTAKEV